MHAVETEVQRVRDEQAAVRNAIERAEQRAATNRARVGEFTTLRDQARQEIAGTEEKVRVGEDQLKHLNERGREIHATARSETQRRHEEEQEALQMLSARVGNVESERAEVEEQKLSQERLHQRQEQELAALELQQRNYQLRLETLQTEQTAIVQRRDEAQAALETQKTKLAEAENPSPAPRREALEHAQQARREAEGKQLRDAEKARSEAARAHQQMLARRDALSQLEDSHASAPEATQRLLKFEEETKSDLHGTLSTHIAVQSGFETPLALLARRRGQRGSCLSDDNAVQAWRERLSGKEQCAFAPLHSARPTPLKSSAGTHATHFLTIEPIVADLVASLLEDAHVVDDLAAAWRLKHAQPQSVVATRAGELITRAGLLLVGQEASASLTVLTRQTELRKLEVELGDLAAKVDIAQSAAEISRAALEEKTGLVEQERALVQEAEIALATQRQDERAAQQALAQATRQVDDAARELNRLTTQEHVDHERHEKLRENMSAAATAKEEAETRLRDLQTQLDQLAAEEETRRPTPSPSAASNWPRKRSSARPGSSSASRSRIAFRNCASSANSAPAKPASTRSASPAPARKSPRPSASTSRRPRRRSRLTGEARDRAWPSAPRSQAAIDIEETALKTLRREANEVQSGRSENEVKLAEQKLFLNNLREKVRRDYHKELEELPELAEADAATDWAALEIDVSEKRTALDAIGPVNLEAITEYDELEQRYTFLTGQETDLLNSKEQILKAIQEINRTTQKLFAETFEQVKTNFQEMFTQLFNGGKASLKLQDESDPLECGIEIEAKPPGKQPQSVSLLSGGERTMTAVALLFAIYMVKPSPFCVLDELDAPLDESNINRFINILKRFVTQSQFVVITHNKRTISIADVLYGVTMEERGVSKFVSLRLQKHNGEKEHAPSIAESVAG